MTAPFKVGNRVEVLDTMNAWRLGRIVGTTTIAKQTYWLVATDDRPGLESIKIRQDHTHRLKHSDAPMPDRGNPLTQRQKDSGRFEKVLCHTDEGTPFMSLKRVDENAAKQGDDKQIDATTPAAQNEGTSAPVDTNTIYAFQIGDRFNECYYSGETHTVLEITKVSSQDDPNYVLTEIERDGDKSSTEWEYTYADLMRAIEQGQLVNVSKRVIVGEVVSVTDRKPVMVTDHGDEFHVGSMFIRDVLGEDTPCVITDVRKPALTWLTYKVPHGEYVSNSANYVHTMINNGSYRHATQDEKLAYLTAEADRLDEQMAALYDQRASVVREIERLRNEKFYSNQVQKSVNFRAQYPTLQDYLNSLTGR